MGFQNYVIQHEIAMSSIIHREGMSRHMNWFFREVFSSQEWRNYISIIVSYIVKDSTNFYWYFVWVGRHTRHINVGGDCPQNLGEKTPPQQVSPLLQLHSCPPKEFITLSTELFLILKRMNLLIMLYCHLFVFIHLLSKCFLRAVCKELIIQC